MLISPCPLTDLSLDHFDPEVAKFQLHVNTTEFFNTYSDSYFYSEYIRCKKRYTMTVQTNLPNALML